MEVIKPTLPCVLLVTCTILWLLPASRPICIYFDEILFKALNNTLQYSHAWQLFCGYLSHPNESWLNILIMIGINLLGILSLDRSKRRDAFAVILYYWLFYQVVICISHAIFSRILGINRSSPTLVLPAILLSQTLDMPSLKIASYNCFPAGHALIAAYWAGFSIKNAKPWIHTMIWLVVIMLILPRWISGAHWPSDIIFSILYGLVWLGLARNQLTFDAITRYFAQVLISTKKPQRAHPT